MFDSDSITQLVVVVFNHKTAYEMRISDWSSDVCSSDLPFSVTTFEDVDGGGTLDLGDVVLGVVEGVMVPAGGITAIAVPVSGSAIFAGAPVLVFRSEERRVGKECVTTCSSRCAPCH